MPNIPYTDKLLEEYTLTAGELPPDMVVMPVKDAITYFSLLLEELAEQIDADKLKKSVRSDNNQLSETQLAFNDAISLAVERVRGVMK